MSLVVSDTTPLNYLVLIGHVDVLPRLFGTVYAPPAVMRELRHPRTPLQVAAWANQVPAWLVVNKPTIGLRLGIGDGEDEAISLAIDLGKDTLLVDDRKARAAAQNRGLPVLGTLAILDLADETGLLDFEDALARLRGTTFHIYPEVANALVQRVRRRKAQS